MFDLARTRDPVSTNCFISFTYLVARRAKGFVKHERNKIYFKSLSKTQIRLVHFQFFNENYSFELYLI